MKYIVIRDFKDLEDKNKIYRKGDRYPKPSNKKISDERLTQLSSNDNKQKKPVIQVME